MTEVNGDLSDQVASAREQLETLLVSCDEAGDGIASSACRMALSAIQLIENKINPPKKWESKF